MAGFTHRPVVELSERLSALTGAQVFVKYEILQVTNSFKDRGALVWWPNRNLALLAVSGTYFAPGAFDGVVLVKLDLTTQVMTLIATGLEERATLAGIQGEDAVFLLPSGGMAFFPVP